MRGAAAKVKGVWSAPTNTNEKAGTPVGVFADLQGPKIRVGMFKDGTGQVLLTLVKGQRIAYIALWPHCRVFKFAEPQPVLRGLVQPKQVADILARAVNEFATAQGETVQRSAVRDVAHDTLTVPQTAGA